MRPTCLKLGAAGAPISPWLRHVWIAADLALSATVPIAKTSAVRAALYFEDPLVVHRGLFLRRNLVIRVIHRDSAYGGSSSSRIDHCRSDLEHAQRVRSAFQLAVSCRDKGGNMIIFTPSWS